MKLKILNYSTMLKINDLLSNVRKTIAIITLFINDGKNQSSAQ